MYFKPSLSILVLTTIILAISNQAEGSERQLTVTWNPDCESQDCPQQDERGSYTNLVHVKLTGQEDVVHMLYSTIESFSIMLFRTSLNANLNVNWTNLLSKNATLMRDSIVFTEKPIEFAGYEMPSLIEFVDVNGNADISQANETFIHKTSDLVWSKFVSNDTNSGVFEGHNENSNGSFKFLVKYPGKDQRDKSLPHLLLNSESSSIDFMIDSVEPKSKFSKFGLNIVFLSEFKLSVSSLRTIDDEYTPGTFKLWNAELSDNEYTVHGFLQWKPIFYYFDTKTLENSTITKQYDAKEFDLTSSGIGLSFFDENKLFSAMNVSFGLEGNEKDGYYYTQTNYSSWSFSVGLGAPPKETMSSIVTLVIIVGFGLPALVILIGLVVMVVKKIRRSGHSEFSQL